MLGALPLLVAGIQGYSDAMGKINGARKYRSILIQYNDELILEEAALQNTWFAIVSLGQYAIMQHFPELSLAELQQNPYQAMANNNIPLKSILLLALPHYEEQHLEAIVRTFERLHQSVTTLAQTFAVKIDSQESSEVCSTSILFSIMSSFRSRY